MTHSQYIPNPFAKLGEPTRGWIFASFDETGGALQVRTSDEERNNPKFRCLAENLKDAITDARRVIKIKQRAVTIHANDNLITVMGRGNDVQVERTIGGTVSQNGFVTVENSMPLKKWLEEQPACDYADGKFFWNDAEFVPERDSHHLTPTVLGDYFALFNARDLRMVWGEGEKYVGAPYSYFYFRPLRKNEYGQSVFQVMATDGYAQWASEICLFDAPDAPFSISAESLKIFFECVGKKYSGDIALHFNDKGQIVIAGENDNLLVTDLTAPPTNSELLFQTFDTIWNEPALVWRESTSEPAAKGEKCTWHDGALVTVYDHVPEWEIQRKYVPDNMGGAYRVAYHENCVRVEEKHGTQKAIIMRLSNRPY